MLESQFTKFSWILIIMKNCSRSIGFINKNYGCWNLQSLDYLTILITHFTFFKLIFYNLTFLTIYYCSYKFCFEDYLRINLEIIR